MFGDMDRRWRRAAVAMVVSASLCGGASRAMAQAGFLTLANPNWEIDLTDFGYSDYLGDQTPGFEGREYLSGEWAGAVGYTRGNDVGSPVIGPTWLEPNFVYPDWTTNSDFQVESGIAVTGANLAGLPIAQSVIRNDDLRITQTFEMIDTLDGMAMGTSAASLGGGGSTITSNRYVLKQTYSIENISGDDITGLQLFQFLHGLTSQQGVYDNRNYGDALGEYQYDTTLSGVDESWIDPAVNPDGFLDYIGFSVSVAPSATELGYFGLDDGVSGDDHATGKPSVGTHLSVEANSLNGVDAFAPATRWVAGAQRYELGSLEDGQSVDLSTVLSIRSGTQVTPGTGDPPSGGGNGGSGYAGGCDFEFEDEDASGSFYAEYFAVDDDQINYLINHGRFNDPSDFRISGELLQFWKIDFDGTFQGALLLTFTYDDTLLPDGFDESTLAIYHFNDDGAGQWDLLDSLVDPLNNTIRVTVYDLSPFAVGLTGAIPEPATGLLMSAAVMVLLRRRGC